MFELNYSITESDIKTLNKKHTLFYFALYAVIAAVGITVGAIAAALSSQKLMFVLGIILAVLGGVLLLCAIMLIVAPKNMLHCIVPPSDDARNVIVDKHGITVDGENVCMFADIKSVKNKQEHLLIGLDRDSVFIIKNAFTDGRTLDALFAYMSERKGRVLIVTDEDGADGQEPDETTENADASENAQAQQVADGASDGQAEE